MKWKGRRQSNNIEDKTNDPLPDIPEGTVMFGTGEIYHKDSDPYQTRPKEQKYSRDDVKVAKELGRLNKEGKTPVPTPRPKNDVPTPTPNPKSRTHDNLVTPGKWTTKNK